MSRIQGMLIIFLKYGTLTQEENNVTFNQIAFNQTPISLNVKREVKRNGQVSSKNVHAGFFQLL
jgi:hypothetical protein